MQERARARVREESDTAAGSRVAKGRRKRDDMPTLQILHSPRNAEAGSARVFAGNPRKVIIFRIALQRPWRQQLESNHRHQGPGPPGV